MATNYQELVKKKYSVIQIHGDTIPLNKLTTKTITNINGKLNGICMPKNLMNCNS